MVPARLSQLRATVARAMLNMARHGAALSHSGERTPVWASGKGGSVSLPKISGKAAGSVQSWTHSPDTGNPVSPRLRTTVSR